MSGYLTFSSDWYVADHSGAHTGNVLKWDD